MTAERFTRRSPRAPSYDYGSAGAYFVTIVTQGRLCLLGDVEDPARVRPAGAMVAEWWQRIPDRFDAVTTGEFIVMPNHVHGVLFLGIEVPDDRDASLGARSSAGAIETTLSSIVGWFKSMTTNEYGRGVRGLGWPSYRERLWQRSFHDRIIRDRDELTRIRQYIADNPAKWADDRENPSRWQAGERGHT